METGPFPVATGHHGATGLSLTIASHFMLLFVSDVESSLVVHGQSPTMDVVDDRFSASCATSTRPPGHSTIISIADDETVGLSVDEHICRQIQLIRSISLLRGHRPALCHGCHLVSIPQCGDSRSQRRSPCPPHPHGHRKASRVGWVASPSIRVLQRR